MSSCANANKLRPAPRAELVDFDQDVDNILDPDPITREGVTVCPFGAGEVCYSGGCMMCDDGVRCCSAGDTCTLNGGENWCTAFRGTEDGGGGVGVGMMPRFAPDPVSFWARRA